MVYVKDILRQINKNNCLNLKLKNYTIYYYNG